MANDPPTAEAGGPYSGDEGQGILLDASASSDPDGAIVSYGGTLQLTVSPSTETATPTGCPDLVSAFVMAEPSNLEVK